MPQVVGFRLSRLAIRAVTALFVFGVATVALSLTPVGASPPAASTTPYAYVANEDSSTVSVINASTNKVVKTVTVGTYPTGVAITPNGSYAYVANSDANTVSVIKTSTNKVVKTVTVGSDPYGVAIT
jgi:YVTN family beta-propeller protein